MSRAQHSIFQFYKNLLIPTTCQAVLQAQGMQKSLCFHVVVGSLCLLMWNLHLEKAEYNMPFYTRGLSIHGFEYMQGVLEGFPGKESTCNTGDPGSISGLGRSAGEGIGYPLQYSLASLVAQLVNNSHAMQRPGFYPWVGKIPWRRTQQPPPVLLPGKSP